MKEDSVEIRVIQVPTAIEWECEECCTENRIYFKDFIESIGSDCPEDWKGRVLKCEDCGATYKIEGSEWD